jgi:hypothetical protein
MTQAACDFQPVGAIFEIARIDLCGVEILYTAKSDLSKPLLERAGIEKSAKRLARGGYAVRQGIQSQAPNPI